MKGIVCFLIFTLTQSFFLQQTNLLWMKSVYMCFPLVNSFSLLFFPLLKTLSLSLVSSDSFSISENIMVSKKNNANSSNKSKANAGEAAYLQSLNKEQLKRELKRRGIKASGSKTELVWIWNALVFR